ncbi:hypothetical protein AMI01nite_45230 [Aneurinibacillus migulanus]|nr:hypothetical protein AMI01nite_45230 [Aneurinibacillus migulanus]
MAPPAKIVLVSSKKSKQRSLGQENKVLDYAVFIELSIPVSTGKRKSTKSKKAINI